MKKSMVIMAGAALGMALLVGTGCNSAPEQGANITPISDSRNESGVKIQGLKTNILDWQGRSLGNEAVPSWLAPVELGDFTLYNARFQGSNDKVHRSSEGTGADERGSLMRAQGNYARKIARELQQSINVYAADTARSGGISEETVEAIQETTKTKSEVEITGHQQKTTFWHLVETENPTSHRMEQKYLTFIVYEIDPQTWAQTLAKYVQQVLGAVSAKLRPDQKFVEGLVNQMMEDARFPAKISQEQQIAALEASQRVLDAELAAKPGEAERAHDIALAQINQEIVLGKAAAETQQVRAATTAKAQQAAYRSGDPVLVNAASISRADRDWLEAAALAANILF
ncbi:hypothetical protein FACS1894137_00020 [Spirochaetia bacterium]|nr:hypothetical protein FACS1894137_00020 [Spirochaetia bacterium]